MLPSGKRSGTLMARWAPRPAVADAISGAASEARAVCASSGAIRPSETQASMPVSAMLVAMRSPPVARRFVPRIKPGMSTAAVTKRRILLA
jgi:hypothetical protein